jgi:hypothetical protein
MKRPSANRLWTDGELRSAVDAYVFLLRAQQAGIRQRGEIGTYALLESALGSRNEASIRYRMRNISAVVRELGGPVLATYSPAEQVGANVRPRIRDLPLAHPDFTALVRGDAYALYGSQIGTDREYALAKLAELREALDKIEQQVARAGHNNPPEPIDTVTGLPDFGPARLDVDALVAELRQARPNIASTEKRLSGLLAFGVKLGAWVGERATNFVDASLAVLGPALVLQVTGLMPLLLDTISAVARAIVPH